MFLCYDSWIERVDIGGIWTNLFGSDSLFRVRLGPVLGEG